MKKMRMRMRTELALAIALAAAGTAPLACGPTAKKTGPRYTDFVCKDRRASYIATGTLMYQKQGISMTCAGNVPRVEVFFQTDEGKENKRGGIVSGAVWNKSWQDFENAGWRNLKDCENPQAGDREALYDFEIADGDFQSNFQCPGSSLPFPYDTVQQALDSAAGELPPDPGAD